MVRFTRTGIVSEQSKIKNVVSENITVNQKDVIFEDGWGISALWDKRYFNKLDDMFYDIRRGKKELVPELVNLCIDKPKNKGNDFAPKRSHYAHNVITHPGIALTNKNITGEDMTRFLYIFSGTDNTQIPTIYSTGIAEENARMSILDTGFYFASGTALFQGAVFPTSIPDAVVKAFGSATTSDPDDPDHVTFWISRILDVTKYINHFQNKTIYTHMHVVDRRSRLSE